MTDLALPGMAYAEVNWGVWKARCPQPWCWNAVALVLGSPTMQCVGVGACGAESPVVWPADPLAIAALLAMRPDMRTRNWLPHETVEDLLTENAAHDVLPLDWTESGGLVLARTAGGAVVGGVMAEVLPAGRTVRELEGLS